MTLREYRVVVNPVGRLLQVGDSVFSTNQSLGIEGQVDSAVCTIRGCILERNGFRGLYLANGVVRESSFVQNGDGVRSNTGGRAPAVEIVLISNTTDISAGVAIRSNAYPNNVSIGGAPNLGGNVCDGSTTFP